MKGYGREKKMYRNGQKKVEEERGWDTVGEGSGKCVGKKEIGRERKGEGGRGGRGEFGTPGTSIFPT